MKKLMLKIICSAALVSLTGCAPFLIGAGTVGVGADTIRLERFTDLDTAWQATMDALNEQSAVISSEDKPKGMLRAEIDKNELNIEIQAADTSTMAINIKARKKGLPALKFADSLAEKINEKISAAKKAAQEKPRENI